MQYTLTEVDEVPPGWSNRVPPGFYEDILERFIEKACPFAKVEVEGKNPHVIATRLDTRVDESISVKIRGDTVYLVNHSLVMNGG